MKTKSKKVKGIKKVAPGKATLKDTMKTLDRMAEVVNAPTPRQAPKVGFSNVVEKKPDVSGAPVIPTGNDAHDPTRINPQPVNPNPQPDGVAYDLNEHGNPTSIWAHFACTYVFKAKVEMLTSKLKSKGLITGGKGGRHRMFCYLVDKALIDHDVK